MDEPVIRTDEELIADLGRGDAEALGLLYDRYRRLAMAVAYRILDSKPISAEFPSGSVEPRRDGSTTLLPTATVKMLGGVLRELFARLGSIRGQPKGTS